MVYLCCLIVLLSIVIGLSVGLGTYGKRFTEASSSDMIQIKSGISSRFCSGVKITSINYPVDVYMLPGEPVVKGANLTSHKYSKYAALPSYSYEYWGFYLLEKSSVTINVCSNDMGIDYYLIKGEHNLQKWKDDNYCSSCYEFHRGTNGCFLGNSTYTHSIYSSDEYYFVFANHFYHRSSVTVTFLLRRTSYDLSSAVHTCKNTYDCTINYSGEDSRESLVVVLPDIDVDNVDIGSACLRRDWVFVGLFLLMPLGIGFFITALIYFMCIRKKGAARNTYRSLENGSNVNSGYATFQQPSAPNAQMPPPPPYNSHLSPPSYDDATKVNKT